MPSFLSSSVGSVPAYPNMSFISFRKCKFVQFQTFALLEDFVSKKSILKPIVKVPEIRRIPFEITIDCFKYASITERVCGKGSVAGGAPLTENRQAKGHDENARDIYEKGVDGEQC